MRPSSIQLVHKHKDRFKLPILDIGGYGNEARWEFDFKVLDIIEGSDIVADVTQMPEIKNESAGTIICLDTFEHIAQPFKAIDEIYRILKPGGLLILTTVLTWGYHPFPKDYWRFTVDALELLCAKFEKIESGWTEENVPLTNGHVIDTQAGVYFVGVKK
jgi:SAM-dependent methyltransferase